MQTGNYDLFNDTCNPRNGFADPSSWASLNYEPAVAAINETHDDEGTVDVMKDTELREFRTISKALEQKQQKLNKRKLSLDIASDSAQPKKVSKRTRSVGPHKENAQYSILSTESLHSQQYQDCEITQSQNINKEQDLPGVTEKKAKPKCNPSRKRKCDSITSGEHPTKKTKVSNPKVMATEISIMQTIDDVIQQSVEMSPKFVRLEELNEHLEEKMQERDKRSNFCQSASTMKSRKKRDTVKNPVSRGLTLIDTKLESNYNKINNRINRKAKSGILVVKKKNLKIKVKSNAMNTNEISESNDGQLPNPEHINDFSSSDPQIPAQTENNKILEPKNSRTSANGSNKNSRTTSCIPSIDSAKLIKPGNMNEFGKSRNVVTINGYRSKYKNKKFGKRDVEDFQSKRAVDRDIPWSKNPNPSVTPSLVVSTNVQSLASKNRVFVTESGSEKQEKYLEFNDSGSKSVKRPSIRRGTNWRMGEEFINGSPEKCFSISRRPSLKPRWSNGWSWEGGAFEAKVYLTNEESAIRRCYAKMRHESGDVLQPRDCVLLKSGPRKADLPFVAKIAALWENPEDGEMMFSLLWYYRPEHTEQGRSDKDSDDEVFASRHRDANSVACIEDKCYILTFHEYCRYRKNIRRIEEGLDSPGLIVPPGDQRYPREARIPQTPVPQDMVLFCRRVYDYRGKKLVKNPG
ncbi:hypothetical protein QAD02_020285 [Eretmocerus hayati]|uniref:Uncharacterized protein n=1 Tax=Eretmocerus hayati TaxID=131215 RepID=A0ACC2PN85_9HYME|nr:hypothetical protein QAD02_020285 [Eretmocerus hayati]